jgi:predicted membrane-bound spermidine synthase
LPSPSTVKTQSAHWPHVYIAVALTTLAALVLELSLTRIFSVVFYYHFAFLAISIALFGLGAGGVFSYVVAGWRGSLYAKLGWLSAANSLFVVLSAAVVLGQKDSITSWRLALLYLTTSLPFVVAGVIVSLAISETMERVNRVYFFDLLGAAAGCLLLVPFLEALGGPNTTLAVAVLFAAAGSIWHTLAGSVRGRVVSVGLALLLVAFVALNFKTRLLDVKYAKGQKLLNEQFVKWNSFSRVAVAPDRQSGAPLIFIDADASTGIANFDFTNLTEKDRRDLLLQGPGIPYQIRPAAKTLIIGPGGGWDVARALASGSGDVTGVEINPIIANTIMRDKFARLSRGIYRRPDTRIVVEDGRSFIRRSRERYEVIQATLVDTWASTAAGAFALSENNLYTTEAFVDYFSHLTGTGILAFTRWGFEPPRESLRLVSLAMEALARLGEPEPWRHAIVAREGSVEGWGARDTVIFSRKPFLEADLMQARKVIPAGGMEAVYLPGDPPGKNAFSRLLRADDPVDFQRDYPFDIAPVTDNRPFFFYTVQPRDIWAFLTRENRESADYKINRAVPLLFGLMGISAAATLLILALPPAVLGTRLPREPGIPAFLLYFLFIGAAYILVEIALIQKFVLFLGHPTYALTVVIFSMLVSSGLGSLLSRRAMPAAEDQRLLKVLGLIAILIAALALAVTLLLGAAVGLPLPLKVAITVLLVTPAGFLMGMPFPAGLRLLESWHAPSLRWAWSLNAASSVLGSVGALACAIYLGLMQTLMVGGLLYLGALVVVMRVEPQSRARTGTGVYSTTKL